MKVNPAKLRFTQDSIASHFKDPHEHFSVREALEQIRAGKMSSDTFPRLRVILHNDFLWSVDNRRLWVFRMAKCSEITVKMMNTMHPRLNEIISQPSKYRTLSEAEFLPRVRGGQNVAIPKTLQPRVADVMARNGFAGKVRDRKNTLRLANVASTDLHNQAERVMQPFQAFETLEADNEANSFVDVTMERYVGFSKFRPEGSILDAKKDPTLSLLSFPESASRERNLVICPIEKGPSRESVVAIRCSGPRQIWRAKPSRKAIVGIGCSDPHDIVTKPVENTGDYGDSRLLVPLASGDNHTKPVEHGPPGEIWRAEPSREAIVGIGCSDPHDIGTKPVETTGDYADSRLLVPLASGDNHKPVEHGPPGEIWRAEPSRETIVGIGCSDPHDIGTKPVEHPGDYADSGLLVPLASGDNRGLDRYPNLDLARTRLGRVRARIFRCFGCA